MNRATIEGITKVVYGETFDRYDRQEFIDFLRPMQIRLKNNGIDAEAAFKDKRCLDAGCGGGRGTVLMATAGAREVVAYDLSEQNIATTERNAGLFGLDNVVTNHGSLLEIPFPDETFDVVWCNGVVHHTSDPDRALCEVSRVLKKDGFLWLYLYGSGGIYWRMVDFIRSWLSDAEVSVTIGQLALMGIPTTHIAEFIDDWFVPMLKRYTNADVADRLEQLGFGDVAPLDGGMTYDTSVRAGRDAEAEWMGEGDLRYWIRKQSLPPQVPRTPLPDVDGIGSSYQENAAVQSFDQDFERLEETVAEMEEVSPLLNPMGRVLVSARMHLWLREAFKQDTAFDGGEFRRWIEQETDRIHRFVLSPDK